MLHRPVGDEVAGEEAAETSPRRLRWTSLEAVDREDGQAAELGREATGPGPRGGGSFGARLTGDAMATKGEGKGEVGGETGGETGGQTGGPMDGEVQVEVEVCFICASPVVHNAVSPCNHRTCHICALRLRALYKTKACAHCRATAESVIFTDDASKPYEDFAAIAFARQDDNLGIKYETADIFEDTVLLLRYNCPDPGCDVACLGWPDLHRHVKSVHHKVMCDLCTRNKKVFTHEHELFTVAELRRHEKFGDDNPGAVDQSGFKGHPECGFCRQRFYGDDELYTHCRDKHERCHICDRRQQGRQQQYFVDYNSLEIHFRKEHFLCLDRDCLEKKFVVFESEMDLKAHQLEAHPNDLSKDARRDARRIDISGFDYRGQWDDERGNRREGRGRGRGADPRTEPIPASTAQTLRRDELAFQRQMAVQSAQSVSTRTFGGQLTSADPPVGRAPPARQAPARNNVNGVAASLEGSAVERPRQNPPSPNLDQATTTPQEQARRLRHAAVMERASNMLRNDGAKVADFRKKVSRFQHSTLSATELIDAFLALFDASPAELGKLVKELAEIYESETKRHDLLKAWNDWRAINEDYPALPGPSGVLPGSSGLGGSFGASRVLKLKSSTAQSSRSNVSRQGSWGSAGGEESAFPAMAAPSSADRVGAGRVSAARPSSQPTRAKATAPASTDAFPALPAAAKPTSSIFGYGSGAVKRDYGRGTAVAGAGPSGAWGSASAGASAAASESEDAANGAGRRKGGKKAKKQTLLQWG
ncbi:MAG: hypothetical protein M1832_000407 [Thelocarpon impressellum]|nr:MAG: hypothetical protein M1832_000407 [Thelocarpon impressellum]